MPWNDGWLQLTHSVRPTTLPPLAALSGEIVGSCRRRFTEKDFIGE
jgi:hypothetical protein